MRIAVNTRFLIKDRLEGIGWFSYETLKRITRNHPEHEFYFFFDREYDPEFIFSGNITPIVISPPARHPFLWYYWFEYAIPRQLKKLKADIFLSMDGFLSLNTKVRSVLIIHDLAFEHFPQHLGFLSRKYVRKYTPLYAAKADRIATVSQFSKQDIISRYRIPEENIDVVYNGSQEIYHAHYNGEVAQMKDKFKLANNYFIYAGAIHPRKNVGNLFKAFDEFKRKTKSDVQLVLAGRKAWKYKDTLSIYEQMQYRDEVKFLGHIDAAELSVLMAGALSLVYVSKFEGFGLPLVEAMNCNVPVITSNTSSMPEVAGDAALFVNPASVPEIAASLDRIYQDKDLRNELVQKGKIQREKFTWEKTANQLWQTVEKVSNK